MTTQINWAIQSMQTLQNLDNHENVVVIVNWSCTAVNSIIEVPTYGSVEFDTVGDPFTPYEDLTESQVLDWVWNSGVNKVEVENSLIDQVNEILGTPKKYTLPNPW